MARHRERWERRMDAELRFHIDQQIRDYMAEGCSPEEARQRALREFGAVELAKDECRDEHPLRWLDDISRDVRHALRNAIRNPAFTAVAVLTLALGIGSATAIFGIVYAVVLRALPFPHTDRLVAVQNRSSNDDGKMNAVYMLQFQEWRKGAGAFERLGAYNIFYERGSYDLTGVGEPARLSGMPVSQPLLEMLGAKTAAGRLFLEGEDLPGAEPVVLLSYGFWERRFGRSAEIVGRTLTLNDVPMTVAGVLTREFAMAGTLVVSEFDVYLPLVLNQRALRLGGFLGVVGLLRPGVSRAQAAAEVNSLHKASLGNTPLRSLTPDVSPLADRVTRPVRTPLWMLLGAVGLLLLIGCANLANLFLAQGATRLREMAIRTALGAGRIRLIRQMLVESVVLGVLGTALGVALAAGLLDLLRNASEWLVMPRLAELQISWPVLAFAVAACGATVAVFGMAPAIEGTRVDFDSRAEGRQPERDLASSRQAHARGAGCRASRDVTGAAGRLGTADAEPDAAARRESRLQCRSRGRDANCSG
ncbi:MAG: ABC transporter permease [Bryobacteraceae bacterium]